MTHAAQRVKTLIQDMAEDRRHYLALNELLLRQREYIIARRTAELTALNEQIMGCYQTLSQHSQRRYRLLNQLGISASAEGIQRLIARLPASHQKTVAALWQSLQQQAERCHAANERNAVLMNMQQEILTNLLNASEPENWLYQQG
ncbi:flagellar protein FlgN [Intestinirhabdus alba]|jgi:flagella synthesis protein FlgN|uniref:Flagellar protein FlgN n=1 Tax=Intestinirhabdus alba TaxID=2899544 RepID=A0A6L6IKR1_9ENTR|nr:flagellar protein FlgN [Intestinirhabdus alba]MTH46156.1 flagellar protein FlgN [Intestinirhabdus alba]